MSDAKSVQKSPLIVVATKRALPAKKFDILRLIAPLRDMLEYRVPTVSKFQLAYTDDRFSKYDTSNADMYWTFFAPSSEENMLESLDKVIEETHRSFPAGKKSWLFLVRPIIWNEYPDVKKSLVVQKHCLMDHIYELSVTRGIGVDDDNINFGNYVNRPVEDALVKFMRNWATSPPPVPVTATAPSSTNEEWKSGKSAIVLASSTSSSDLIVSATLERQNSSGTRARVVFEIDHAKLERAAREILRSFGVEDGSFVLQTGFRVQ